MVPTFAPLMSLCEKSDHLQFPLITSHYTSFSYSIYHHVHSENCSIPVYWCASVEACNEVLLCWYCSLVCWYYS